MYMIVICFTENKKCEYEKAYNDTNVKRDKGTGIYCEFFTYHEFFPCFFPESCPDCIMLSADVPQIVSERIKIWLRQDSYRNIAVSEDAFDIHVIDKVKESGHSDIRFPLSLSLLFLRELTDPDKAHALLTSQFPVYTEYSFLCCIIHPEFSCSAVKAEHIFLHSADMLAAGGFQFMPYSCGNRYLLLIFSFSKMSASKISAYISTLSQSLNLLPDIQYHMGMSHKDLSGLYSSFFEACETYYVDRLRTPCHFFEEISQPENMVSKASRLVELERAIRTDMEFRNGKNAINYIDTWFDICREQNYSLQNIKCDIILLYSNIKNIIFDMYSLRHKRIKIGMEVYEILNITSIPEMKEWFRIWLTYTLNNFEPVHNASSFQINEVLDFINSHITEELSLERISSYFFISAPYFSSLFKKSTGQTYVSYITSQKMEKARELLLEKHKVYEVAETLGYEDVKHFRNLYEAHFGYAPSRDKK